MPARERGRDPQVNMIAVLLARRVETRVKIAAYGADRLDLNRGRQSNAEGGKKFPRIVGPVGVEMKHLPMRMHAGIRPAAAMDSNRVVEYLRQPAFDHVLNCTPSRLTLPAGEFSSVV